MSFNPISEGLNLARRTVGAAAGNLAHRAFPGRAHFVPITADASDARAVSQPIGEGEARHGHPYVDNS